jgi:phosphatidylglycerol:prolipoprotein diacylglycerol transferase
MYPFVTFSLLGQKLILSSYNILTGIGLIIALLILEHQLKLWSGNIKENNNIYYACIAGLFSALIGSHLFDAILHQRSLYDGILQSNNQLRGFTFYGGLIAGIACGSIILKILDIALSKALNLVTPSIIFGHSLGRIGCYLAGCCYGKIIQIGQLSIRVPTQLIESIFLFLLGIVIINWAPFKKRFFLYILTYGFFRFFLEFLRGDDRGYLLLTWLSPSQIVSICLIIIGITYHLIQSHQNFISNFLFVLHIRHSHRLAK